MATEVIGKTVGHGDNYPENYYTEGRNDSNADIDLDRMEDPLSPDSERFYHLMGRMMATTASKRVVDSEDIGKSDPAAPGQIYVEENAQVDEDSWNRVQAAAGVAPSCGGFPLNDSENAVRHITGRAAADEMIDHLMESLRRKRFFGIYHRVRLKAAWRKLASRPGIALRTKKLRIMDIDSDAPLLHH